MPVYSLEGTPGSGKSLYLCQKIIPDFLKIRNLDGSLVPRHIYTNIEGLKPDILCAYIGIPGDAIASYFHVLGQRVDDNGNVYEDKDLIRYFYYEPESIVWKHEKDEKGKWIKVPDLTRAVSIPHNSLVIIDELQNYFGGRDFATRYSRDCVEFLTKNRHFGWTIWWASQSVESVDITFRRNTQYVYFLEKKEIYGFRNSASVKIYEGWLSGEKSSVPPFAVKSFTYDKKFYNVYNSYVAGGVQEKRYVTNVFLNHKGFMAMVILALVGIIFTIISGNPLDKLTPSKDKKKEIVSQAKAPPTNPTTSSSGGVVGEGNDFQCYEKEFTASGIHYIVVRGVAVPWSPKSRIKPCWGSYE